MVGTGEGIYLNTATSKVLRVVTAFNAPQGEEWQNISDDVMMTMSEIRKLARSQNLVSDASQIHWGEWQ